MPPSKACSSAPKPRPARKLPLDADARDALVQMADGDGRAILNLAEDVFATVSEGATPIGREELVRLVSAARRSTTRAAKVTTT